MIEINITFIDEETKFFCTITEKFEGSLIDAIAHAADKIAFGMTEEVVDLRFRTNATPS